MMRLFCWLFVLCFGWSFDQLVFSIDSHVFDLRDLYLKYSRNEWDSSPLSTKKTILKDYLKREGVFLEAVNLGYENDPIVMDRLFQIEKQFLINLFYEHRVAGPLVSDRVLKNAENHIKKEFFVKHVLVSHNKSSLQNPVNRTGDDALALSTKIISSLIDSLNGEVASFDSLALLYSDDPSVLKNRGALGWIQWGLFVDEFQEAVFNSGGLGILGPIETKYGYHVVAVDSLRDSAFSVDSDDVVAHEAFSRSLRSLYNSLKPAAAAFDSLVLNDNLFHLNSFVVDDLFDGLKDQLSTTKPLGGTFNLSEYLLEIETPVLLFSFQGRGFGPFWLGNQLRSLPPSRVPQISSQKDFVNLIKLFVLKEFAYKEALDSDYLNSGYFSRNFGLEKKRVVYDYYLRDLVNSVSVPDSFSVLGYYEKEQGNKYYNKERVVVKRLKVLSRNLADSLGILLEKNPGAFDLLVNQFTEHNPNGGGLMGPFERGKYNFIGEVAFKLDGGVSSVIESLDKTFSFIRVEEFFPRTPVPLKTVYKKIESLLLRNLQTGVRDSVLNRVGDRHVVVWGEGFEQIFNGGVSIP